MPRAANKKPYRYTVIVDGIRYTYSALTLQHAVQMHDLRGLGFRYALKRGGFSPFPLGTVIREHVATP